MVWSSRIQHPPPFHRAGSPWWLGYLSPPSLPSGHHAQLSALCTKQDAHRCTQVAATAEEWQRKISKRRLVDKAVSVFTFSQVTICTKDLCIRSISLTYRSNYEHEHMTQWQTVKRDIIMMSNNSICILSDTSFSISPQTCLQSPQQRF